MENSRRYMLKYVKARNRNQKKDLFEYDYEIPIILEKDFIQKIINSKKSYTFMKTGETAVAQLGKSKINRYLQFAKATYKDKKFNFNKTEKALEKIVSTEVI